MFGDLASLHRCHRRQRQLAADVAGCIDVFNIGATVRVDRDVATIIQCDSGGVEVEIFHVWLRANGEHRMGSGDLASVITLDDDFIADTLD